VHNGIEYGDMQIIAEAYQLMKEGLGLSNDEMSAVFGRWNKGLLESYLIEITRDILAYRDEDGRAVVDLILDSAGQKGTGKWTVASALEQGTPLTLVGEAVFARFLSSLVSERAAAAELLSGPDEVHAGDRAGFVADLEQAVYGAKIASYAQGYMLMGAAAGEYGWHLNLGGIALMWRGGCIIRSAFLGKIKEAYDGDPELPNLLLAPYFQEAMAAAGDAWRRMVASAVQLGIPAPALASALSFYDGYRRERLPANLTQAQRDYFGAHTYERVDRPRGQFFHTNWTGRGGEVTSRAYQA
jgi:6-phosphogluconate dehydrogenase